MKRNPDKATREALEEAERQGTGACKWAEDDDAIWNTDCGHAFVFTDDPPHDYMKFCCYCGKSVAFTAYDALALIDAEEEAERQEKNGGC